MLSFPQEPMLAKPIETLPIGEALPGGCLYEPKFDGYRGMLFLTESGCRVQSRGGHDITAGFSDVANAAAAAFPPGVILDGELVVWGSEGLDFRELQRRLASGRPNRQLPASFAAFDVLQVEDTDLRSHPLHVRRLALETLLEDVPPPIQLVPQTADVDEARQWLAQYAEVPVGIEGLVIKGRSARYVPGKRNWLKLRIRDTVEAIVAAVTGSVHAPERLVLALRNSADELVFAGTTTELNPRQRDELGALLEEPSAEEPHPWANQDARRGIGRWGSDERTPTHLVRPALVVEISADTSVEQGQWRHPTRFVRARSDLAPSET
jgi:ATP-dependent DNA ligase